MSSHGTEDRTDEHTGHTGVGPSAEYAETAADATDARAEDRTDNGGERDSDRAESAARIATDLRAALGPLVRRLRQFRPDDEATLSQTSVLVRLDREGPATASELAAAEGIRPQSMCTIVNTLGERGLVTRHPDPHDGRRMVVSLTAEGRDGLNGARRERGRRLALAISEELTPQEQKQLAAAIPLLERITPRV
ncbi:MULTISPECIES: MarR family winged helix-turn-helix transcriptional regulator [unclassified Streptomyces]|uniref:MarR family winged helix-turn-helix transcriptional regulator n=1 Tax=unclassified Streptomyces TaxID=2593676 RepID=UPI002E28D4D3|nr:MarR family transcriptional regulator [Streptomyces sp. NBC_00223]